ncbi:hypothetical protein DFP73DRAFT_542086 [Morchella snyderi]|nr:hypothetical protein DFP73DRAFT_542086 [Morchella snyderi]
MASTTTDVAPPTGPSAERTGSNTTHHGGYRGRVRRSGGGPGGAGEGWGGSRGPRGGSGARGRQKNQNKPQDGVPEDEQRPKSRASVLAGPAAPQTTAVVKPDADDVASDTDSPVCFICADPVTFSAIAPCTHTTCHICALRMRALYKNRACAHCRTEAEWVIFSKLEEKKFTDFTASDIVSTNETLGIKFDDKAIENDTNLLLRYNCPIGDCTRACRGWPDLNYHVRTTHSRVLCDLCVRNKKVFTHEHTLFTHQELRKHERTGDDQPGSENQSGFKGHPECGFCRQRFYSSDELFTHCRDKHERCHICDRRNPTAQQQYYIDYNSLAAHFTKDHFMCADEECMEKKFIVFENEVDLKAHQLEVHPNGLSKNAKRDARRIDLSQFAEPRSNDRGGNRRHRNDGRGQQEREEAPIRTEQQMTRAELAYHRTLAVQSAQSTTTQRTFRGQLTEPAYAARAPPPPPAARPAAQPVAATTNQAPPARPPARPAEPTPAVVAAAVARHAFPPLARPSPPAPATSSSATRGPITNAGRGAPVTDDIKRLRHFPVIDRASNMLQHNDKKLNTFKANISRYRQDYLTAGNLVNQFWALFDTNASELGILIKELADLFEDEPKRQGLLKAWNDWKIINEDYPPFAGASSSSSRGTQSSRVLKVKSSTSHSARSTTARQGAWGAAAVVPSSSSATSSSAPSSAPGPAPRSANHQGPGAHAPTPWVAPSAPARSAASGSSVVTRPSRKVGKDEFPSLPTKPPPPPGWGPIKKKDPQAGAWGGGGSGGEQSADPSESEEVGGSSNAGKKKNGKQKQILFHVGL